MTKVRAAVGVVVALLLSLVLIAGAAPAAAKPSRVSIAPWERGVLGVVTGGPEACREGRKVAVFRQRGDRPRPGSDKRIASKRTRGGKGPAIWYAETKSRGPLYAKTRRTEQCAPRLSRSTMRAGIRAGAEDNEGYPPCGPYVSEGVGTICKLDQVSMRCDGPSFTRGSGTCSTRGANLWVTSGNYPWGLSGSGDARDGELNWNHGDHGLVYKAYEWQSRMDDPVAFLRGTIPGPGSADFHIDDAWGRADSGPNSGDHFYTPDLPGQRAGEPGGPLYLDFEAHTNNNDVYIRGYLYLKP